MILGIAATGEILLSILLFNQASVMDTLFSCHRKERTTKEKARKEELIMKN